MKAKPYGYSPGHGTSIEHIKCSCGFKNLFYIWSWAGHGFARCANCKAEISYRTLEITLKKKEKTISEKAYESNEK